MELYDSSPRPHAVVAASGELSSFPYRFLRFDACVYASPNIYFFQSAASDSYRKKRMASEKVELTEITTPFWQRDGGPEVGDRNLCPYHFFQCKFLFFARAYTNIPHAYTRYPRALTRVDSAYAGARALTRVHPRTHTHVHARLRACTRIHTRARVNKRASRIRIRTRARLCGNRWHV